MPDPDPQPPLLDPPAAPADGENTFRYEDGLPTPADGPSGAFASVLAALPPLSDLPGFVLDGEIGRGGAGVVFRARRTRGGEIVAVKMLRRADPDEPRELARFVTEAETASAVDHPNVVRLLSYGEHLGRPYLVLEHCGGGTLAQRLRRDGPLPPRTAAALAAGVADGVHAVHLAGVVHRDVKPGNVLFDAGGVPKVGDFGLAKRTDADTDLTRSRAVLGSPAYMAPEQARGGTKFVGPAADVWAVGVLLYECLAGTVPFAGPDPLAVLRKITDDPPAPLRKAAPGVPRDLALVCHKCLSKDPADRYPTAAALATDLRAVVAGRPVAARPPHTGRRLVRWARAHPGAAALWGGLAVTLAVGGVTAAGLAARFRQQQRATAAALDRAVAERQGTWEALNTLTDDALERLLGRQPNLTPADRAYLGGVVAQFERAVVRQPDAPDAARLVPQAQFRVARLRHRLGEVGPAEDGYRAAAAGFRAALARDPADAAAAGGLAESLEHLGWLLAGGGRLPEAEAATREAEAVADAHADPFHRGKARNALGLVLAQANRPAEAAPVYRAALLDLLPVGEPAARAAAQVRVNLARVLAADPAAADEAEELYRAAVAEYDRLLAADPLAPRDRIAAARARTNLGRLHAAQGEAAAAAKELAAAAELAGGLVQELPAYPDYQHELGRALTAWAGVERAADPAAALRKLKDAAAAHRKAVKAEPTGRRYRNGLADNRRLHAEVALSLGQHDGAARAAAEFAEVGSASDRPAAAALLRRCAALARWDPRLPPAERAAVAARYAGQASRL